MAQSNAERQRRFRARQKAREAAERGDAGEQDVGLAAEVRPSKHGTALYALDVAKARKMSAEAQRAELDLAKRRGEQVSVSEVKAGLARTLASIRASLEALPSRLKMRRPDLSAEDLAALHDEVATVANAARRRGEVRMADRRGALVATVRLAYRHGARDANSEDGTLDDDALERLAVRMLDEAEGTGTPTDIPAMLDALAEQYLVIPESPPVR